MATNSKHIFLVIGALAACSSETPRTAPSAPQPAPTRAVEDSGSAARGQRFVTPTGKAWTLRESKRSASLSAITVAGEGFPHTLETLELGEGDPLEAAYVTDLNGDGWSELIVVRRSAGSGSYADLAALASNSDVSFGPVAVAKPNPSDPLFAGYQGHDTVRVDGPCLMRSFPVYRDGDPNAQPGRGQRDVCYRLERAEAGFALVPRAVTRDAGP